MNWGAPHLLWALAALPVLAALGFFRLRRKRHALAQLTDPSMISALTWQHRAAHPARSLWLWLAATGLLLTALARPQWGEQWRDVQHRGLNILVALDTSKSMLAEDLKPNRLQQAKWGIRDLVDRLTGDRIGLIPFAGTSFLQCPLTVDYAAFLMTLNDVYAGIIPRGGTAITETLNAAINALEDEEGSDRVILLITDGEDHEGDPLTVIPALQEKGIRVFAIGVGSPEGELIPTTTRNGQSSYLKDRDGNVVKTALKEDVLEELALQTQGLYLRAVGGDFGVDALVEQGLANLQREESESRQMKTYTDRFGWFIGGALLLLVIEAVGARGPLRPEVHP